MNVRYGITNSGDDRPHLRITALWLGQTQAIVHIERAREYFKDYLERTRKQRKTRPMNCMTRLCAAVVAGGRAPRFHTCQRCKWLVFKENTE